MANEEHPARKGWYRQESKIGPMWMRDIPYGSAETVLQMKTHAEAVQKALLEGNPSGLSMQYIAFGESLLTGFLLREWQPVTAEALAEQLTFPELDLLFAQLFEQLGKLRLQGVHASVLSFENVFIRKVEGGWEAVLGDLLGARVKDAMPAVLPEANAYTRKDIVKWMDGTRKSLPPEGGDSYALACMFQETLTLARKVQAQGKKGLVMDPLHKELFGMLKARHNTSLDPGKTSALLRKCARMGGSILRFRLERFPEGLEAATSLILSAEDPDTQLSYSRWKAARSGVAISFEEEYAFLHYSVSLRGASEDQMVFSFPKGAGKSALEFTLRVTGEGKIQILSEKLLPLTGAGQVMRIEPVEAEVRVAQPPEEVPVRQEPARVPPKPVPPVSEGNKTPGVRSERKTKPAVPEEPEGREEEKKNRPPQAWTFEPPRNYIVRLERLEHGRYRITMVNGRSFVIQEADAGLYGLESFMDTARD